MIQHYLDLPDEPLPPPLEELYQDGRLRIRPVESVTMIDVCRRIYNAFGFAWEDPTDEGTTVYISAWGTYHVARAGWTGATFRDLRLTVSTETKCVVHTQQFAAYYYRLLNDPKSRRKIMKHIAETVANEANRKQKQAWASSFG